MRLDLSKLQAFVEVVRTGSLVAAARRLHVTPSAVSHALRRLQDSAGRPLLEWRGRQLSLTEYGDELFQACQHAFDRLEEAERRLQAGPSEERLHLSLGATVEFGATVLLRKLRPLLDATPGLHLDFHFGNDLTGPLLRDEIDLAVDCRPHPHPAVHRTRLFRERYVVVATPAFLEAHPVRTPMDLRRTPVLSLDREGTWWNNLLRALPASRRPTLEHIVVIDHVRGMINGTRAGYGVSLLPKYSVLGELEAGALVALFPRLTLLEDSFSLFQKLSRRERPANLLLTRFLLALDVREFGDAMGHGAL